MRLFERVGVIGSVVGLVVDGVWIGVVGLIVVGAVVAINPLVINRIGAADMVAVVIEPIIGAVVGAVVDVIIIIINPIITNIIGNVVVVVINRQTPHPTIPTSLPTTPMFPFQSPKYTPIRILQRNNILNWFKHQ